MDAKSIAVALMLVAAAAAQHDHHNHAQHRVNVAVYYESLCPDSIKFFTKQLYPSLQGNLSQFVNLTLIPYGRATQTFVVNQYEFICKHGPRECDGNKLQGCALHLIKSTDGLGYNKVATAFINCLMDKVERKGNATQFPTTTCATLNDVTNLSEIQNCANDVEGSNYLAEYGRMTGELTPKLSSVPTIVFNGHFKADDNTVAQENFVKALCRYIQDDEKPAECSRNSATTLKAGAFVAVALLTLSVFH